MDLEGCGRVVEVLHRREPLPRLDVVQDDVAVRERAALGVLAGEPDRDPVDEQRRHRERFRLAPVDAALVERVAAPLELLHQLRVRLEAFRDAQQLLVQRAQPVGRDRSHDLLFGRRGDASVAHRLRHRRAEALLQVLVRLLQLPLHLVVQLL